MPIDLERGDPHQLVDSPLDELREALPPEGAWSERKSESLDYAIAHRVLRALRCDAEHPELLALLEVIHDAAAIARDEPGMSEWSLRWRGIARVVDARIGTLSNQRWQPLLKYQHVVPIVETVRAHEGITQQALLNMLPEVKSAPNLTRVLNMMEANELIVRRKQGRENSLYLGRNAPPPKQPPQTPKHPAEVRPVTLLIRPRR